MQDPTLGADPNATGGFDFSDLLYDMGDLGFGGFGNAPTFGGLTGIFGGTPTSGGSSPWDAVNRVLNGFGRVLNGTSSAGTAGQLLGIGGLGWLLNKLFTQDGDKPGYAHQMPKYTAQRQQYVVPRAKPLVSEQERGALLNDQAFKDYMSDPNLGDFQRVQAATDYGLTPDQMAAITNKPVADVNTMVRTQMGPNSPVPRRPGQGGITYFSPMRFNYAGFDPERAQDYLRTAPAAAPAPNPAPAPAPATGPTPSGDDVQWPYSAHAAGGPVQRNYAMGGLASLQHGNRFVQGPGDGVSDSIPVQMSDGGPGRLADGEFVFDARTVSEIGNGSSQAGAQKLMALVNNVHQQRAHAQRGKPSGADQLAARTLA